MPGWAQAPLQAVLLLGAPQLHVMAHLQPHLLQGAWGTPEAPQGSGAAPWGFIWQVLGRGRSDLGKESVLLVALQVSGRTVLCAHPKICPQASGVLGDNEVENAFPS